MNHDVLIIGAGLAGLRAARELQSAGQRVLVLDKGRGVSGRASTRRWDGTPVDHGAQFFTARSEVFKAQVEDWKKRGVCFEWAMGFHQWTEEKGLCGPDADKDHHPRHACREGMSALGKDLAASLDEGTVRLGARVTALRPADGGWEVIVEGSGERFTAPRVLLTLPTPQALALFGEGSKDLDPVAREVLGKVGYAPCITAMLRGTAAKPEWKEIQFQGDKVLTSISDDTGKRDAPAPGQRIFVVHGYSDFSFEWQDRDLEEAARLMVTRAGEVVGDWITTLPDQQLHRWRYSSVPKRLEERPFLRTEDGLFFAGDAFGDSKVEGAYHSGMEAAKAMLMER